MSGVYRIFGVHYTDVLDFLGKQIAKHGSIDKYFEYLSNGNSEQSLVVTEQMELMMKIGTLYWSIDTLKDTTEIYWKGIARSSAGFIATMSILLAVLTITTVVLIYKTAKRMRMEKADKPTVFKMVLLYTIMALIISLVLIIILKNMSDRMKYAKNMRKDIVTQVTKFKTSILSPRDEVCMALKYLIYISRRNTNTKLLNDIKKTAKSSSSSVFTESDVDSIFQPKTFFVDKLLLFRKVQANLRDSLKQFYNGDNGENGYQKMKRVLVSSNNFLMLKEMKSSIIYYYYLVEKSKSEQTDDIEKYKGIIDSVVIKGLKDLSLASSPTPGDSLEPSVKNTLMQKNVVGTPLGKSYEDILTRLCYLAYFLYPLYIQKDPAATDFPVTNFYQNMPHVTTDIESLGPDYRDIFVSVYKNQYANYMQQCIEAAGGGQAALMTVLDDIINNNFEPYLDELFQSYANSIGGDYKFIYNTESMTDAIRSRFQTNFPFRNVSTADANYADTISQFFGGSLIPDLWTKFIDKFKSGSMIEELRSKFVSDASTNLLKTDIKSVSAYKSYIFDKLQESHQTVDVATLSLYNMLFQKIDMLLAAKRATNTNPFEANIATNRFINASEFSQKIDTITLRDLQDELNVVYLSNLVQNFYQNISTNVDAKNALDIYFPQRRKEATAKIIVGMVSTIVGLMGAHYVTSLYQELSEASDTFKKLSPEQQKIQEFELTQKKSFIWLRIVIVLVGVFFFISLLISFLKNIKEKNEFNRETIETNTASFKDALNDLNTLLAHVSSSVTATGGSNTKQNTQIGKLTEITPSDKEQMYKLLVNIIERYEKCNYINASGNVDLQFPFAEASMNMFILIIAIFAFYYITAKLTPLERIKKIKELNILKDKLQLGLDPKVEIEIGEIFGCHMDDMEGMMFTLKIIMFIFIIVFLIFYSVLILSSSSNFKYGLYNSRYFEQSKCYDM